MKIETRFNLGDTLYSVNRLENKVIELGTVTSVALENGFDDDIEVVYGVYGRRSVRTYIRVILPEDESDNLYSNETDALRECIKDAKSTIYDLEESVKASSLEIEGAKKALERLTNRLDEIENEKTNKALDAAPKKLENAEKHELPASCFEEAVRTDIVPSVKPKRGRPKGSKTKKHHKKAK